MARRRGTLAAALACTAVLAGCGSDDPNEFPPACPAASILADGADLTRNDGHGFDITNVVLDGRMTGLQGKCRRSEDHKTLDAELRVGMDLTRGPSAAGRTAAVPYFVAVSRDDRILDKRVLTINVTFPANTDRLHVDGEPVMLAFPTPKGVIGPNYKIVVGFQLTPQELAANRRRGPR